MPAEHDLTEAIASVRLNPRLMSTAALVAAQAQLTRELGDRGVGGPLSDAVGAYAGVLTARALGGHVATVHPQGADVVTMEGDRVRVRTHLRQHPRRYGRAEFAALLVGEVRRAIVIDLHPRPLPRPGGPSSMPRTSPNGYVNRLACSSRFVDRSRTILGSTTCQSPNKNEFSPSTASTSTEETGSTT